jgi:hypothetical protein
MPSAVFARFAAARRVIACACLSLAVWVVLAGLVAPPANAECDDIRWEIRWSPDLTGTTGGSLIRVPVCHGFNGPSAKPEKKKRKAPPTEPTRKQLRALRYRPSDAVSETVRRRLVEQLAYGDQAEAARTQIESGDLMRQFSESLRDQTKWSTRDVGDMYTFAYLQLWLGVNNRTTVKSAVVRAVREELRRRLALDRRVGGARDAKQQEIAEWFGSWTVALIGYRNHLRQLGDTGGLDAHREHMRDLMTEPDMLDVDLAQIRLTRRGIEHR